MRKVQARRNESICIGTSFGSKVARPPGSPRLLGVLNGEGIGPEVVGAALKVLAALDATGRSRFEIMRGGAIGKQADPEHGRLTEESEAFFRDVFSRGGVILTGPGEGRFVYDLRRRFDLFCKIVPLRAYDELSAETRLRQEFVKGVDIVLVRDNISGIYQGNWSIEDSAHEGRRAVHSFAYSERQVLRIVEPAARIAASRRGKLLVIVKDGGLPALSEIWRDCASSVTRMLGVECSFANIDLAAYWLIQHAQNLDVIVAPNLFGDILADLGAVLLGSRGVSFSGNFSASGDAVYQTNHGAAVDLTGTDRANPIGQIFSLAMLLRESFGLAEEAELIEAAVLDVWRAGWRTPDMAGPGHRVLGCREMADLIAESVMRLSTQPRRMTM
jgi:3-isopropylmalate dehydrogenase